VLFDFCHRNDVDTVVCDFSPTRIARRWVSELVRSFEEEEGVNEDATSVRVIEVSSQ
jgi:hypothetical protein